MYSVQGVHYANGFAQPALITLDNLGARVLDEHGDDVEPCKLYINRPSSLDIVLYVQLIGELVDYGWLVDPESMLATIQG